MVIGVLDGIGQNVGNALDQPRRVAHDIQRPGLCKGQGETLMLCLQLRLTNFVCLRDHVSNIDRALLQMDTPLGDTRDVEQISRSAGSYAVPGAE